MSYELLTGRCEIRLKELPDNSKDSIVTDPPYHLTSGKKGGSGEASLGFMGMAWDGGNIAYNVDMWRDCLRILKPGGHLLAFGGTRTYHRLACAIEDAGFEIRDQLGWAFGSGFPKSHNLHGDWEGWGTALKPAWEPICVARKPFNETVAANVLQYGTGALNIAACRVGTEVVPINRLEAWSGFGQEKRPDYTQTMSIGRWPANLIHDGSDEVLAAFPDAPGQCADIKYDAGERKTQNIYGAMKRGHEPSADSTNDGVVGFKMKPGARRLDEGSAARFFYCAKTSQEDRNEGCETIIQRQYSHDGRETPIDNAYQRNASNAHPTVKPTALMRYLCKLITPPGGTILDPFTGSGSTGKAAILEGFNFIGIEQSEEYVAIAEARIAFAVEEVKRGTAQQVLFA